jgi:hypothetical protein
MVWCLDTDVALALRSSTEPCVIPHLDNAYMLIDYFEKRESYFFGCVYFIPHLSSLPVGAYFE